MAGGGNRRALAGWLAAISTCAGACRAPRAAAPPDAVEPPNGDSRAAADERWIHGSLLTRAVARSTDGEDDLDLYEVLTLDFGDAAKDRWTGHFTGRAAWDVDGASPSFASAADSHGDELDLDLYDAYVETRDRGAWSDVKIGRQFVHDTPVGVWLDGVAARTKARGARRWSTGVLGGKPVHAFEASSSGDALFGLFQEVWPSKWLRARADWMHVEDERVQLDDSDDLLGLSLFHDAGGRLRWDARYTRLEGDDRDVSLGASWIDFARGLTVQASFYRLLETQRRHALELSPFFDTLLTLYPYEQARLSASKSLGARVQLQGGLDVRRVEDDADLGPFNHDFERAFVTGAFERVLPWDTRLALTAEGWEGDGAYTRSWGADLSRRWSKSFEANAGSAYALFKFDPFAGSERNDVRTYYAGLRYRASAAATLQLRFEHEDADLGDFESLRGGLTWRF